MAIGKRSKQPATVESDGRAPIFEGLRRGVGTAPVATVRTFPSPTALADNPELRFSTNNTQGKIFLGLANATIRPVAQSDGVKRPVAMGGDLIGYGDDRHVCTVAGNRAGKGRSLIINNLLTYPGSTLVIDPKGDLALETARHRATALKQSVYVLDPFEATGGELGSYIRSFNPLQWIDTGDPDAMVTAASLIADALIVSANENDPHWSLAGKHFVEAVILHVCSSPEYEGRRTLSTVYDLLSIDVESEAFCQAMAENDAANGSVARGAMAFYAKAEKERSSVISTVRRHLHFLDGVKMREVLQDGPFDLGSLQREPVTLYLSLPAMAMSSCAGWLRMFVNLALNAFEANERRRDFQHQRGGHRVLMLLDEAAVLGRMERLEVAIGQIAGLGVKLWTIWQDLGQAQAIYGRRWESILGNASVLVFFGNNDLCTLDYIEKRLGQTLVYSPAHRSPSLNAAVKEGDTGQSFTLQSHPLMTATEIATIFDRDDPQQRALVFLPRLGAVILQRAFYDQHEAFRKIRVP